MAKKRRTRARSRSRKRRRRGPGRFRRLLGVWVALSVVLAAGTLWLYVSVTYRFDGRLWLTPTRVYSDALALEPGMQVGPVEIVARLDRSGYARTAGAPRRPGQYSRAGRILEVYVRSFQAPGLEGPARQLRIGFEGQRVVSVTDPRGQATGQALIEPELIATLFGPRQEQRQVVALDQIPQRFVRAVLAAEDSRFYRHHGLDLRGIGRAAWANLRQGRIVQGGSTITQQTVKNLFLGQQRTWWRKAREASMAILLDARYSKDRILEVYLNEVYLGQRGPVAICGAQTAARFYFGRDLQDLTLAESALLAGMVRSPGRYNPFRNPEAALERRDQVLLAMERLELAQAAEVEAARVERLALASGGGGYDRASYAVDYVLARLASRRSPSILEQEGLRIYTTLDTTWQYRAEAALESGLTRLERDSATVRRHMDKRRLQGAVLVTRPRTGAVLAMVGGRDYGQSQFNRAVQARRQPGSCFKPLVYAAGFEQAQRGQPSGLTAATLLEDSPLEMMAGGQPWRPLNYDREYRGPVTARTALVQSLNVPTVRAAQRVGIGPIIEGAHRSGIQSELAAVPSLALGSAEVTPLELANAYGTLAHGGVRRVPWVIREVADMDGRPIGLSVPKSKRALSEETAYLINDILQGVLRSGTARSAVALGYRGQAAGKTGTTDDTRDAWFVGYTPELLGLVWVGYDDNARSGLTGASGALPIWVDLMRQVDPRSGRFERPRGVVQVKIDPASGGLARKACPVTVDERFALGTEPSRECQLHRGKFKRWVRKLLGKD